MKLVESFLTKNPCFALDREITVKGIMLQSIGCPQPSAKVLIHNWNRPSCQRVCPHAIVDATDGTIYQTLAWTHRGWHADTIANDNYIGVMICEPNQIKYSSAGKFSVIGDREKAEEAARRTYESAVALFAMLCHTFNLDPVTQIYSHVDLAPAGTPITQKDPEHLWSQLDLPYTMNGFRDDVKAALEKMGSSELSGGEAIAVASGEVAPVEIVSDEKSEVVSSVDTGPIDIDEDEKELPDSIDADTSFDVRVPVSNLRIRKGPGTGAGCEPIGKYTGIGVFRITEVQNGTGSKNGWGRLESGEGWISMDFVERI